MGPTKVRGHPNRMSTPSGREVVGYNAEKVDRGEEALAVSGNPI